MHILDEAIGAKVPFKEIPFPSSYSRLGLKQSARLCLDSICDAHIQRKVTRMMGLRMLTAAFDRLLSSTGARTPQELVHRLGYKMIVPARGCKNACSYCCIKFAVGNTVSVPLPQVIGQFKELVAAGEKKFLLFPDDIGSWGLDIGSHWTTLLKELVSAEGNFKIAVHNLGANDLVQEERAVNEILKTNKIDYIGVMLQHVNPRILRRMNRPSLDVDAFLAVWNRIGKTNIRLTTHFIVGFPGETEEEFQDLFKFIEKNQAKNFHLHIFPYSRREGTLAARKYQKDELSESVIQERVNRLLTAYNKKFTRNFLLNGYHSVIEKLWWKIELMIMDYLKSRKWPDQHDLPNVPEEEVQEQVQVQQSHITERMPARCEGIESIGNSSKRF
jgi:tRNA A37 methylthiotransferase MiaB